MSKKSSDPLTAGGENPPDRVTIRVKVPAATRAAAERLARSDTRRALEIVLAAFVHDMAIADARAGSWEHERVAAWLGSHVWAIEPQDAAPRLRDDEVMDSQDGRHPWDGWERYAVTQGVPAELAALGRAAIREAWQHGWDERRRSLCGWQDDGRRMLRLALRNPQRAEKRWMQLLVSDGGRVDPETGEAL